MRTNWVRERLRAGQPTVGCFLGLESASVAELMARAGYDWLVIETEHNGLDAAEVEAMLRAVEGSETIPLVRVPSANPVDIQRALDLGSMGVVVPMVRTPAEAVTIVRATRYPPAGARSWGPLRASRFTLDSRDYMARANENILVALILETREAVENLEEIVGVEGIDAIVLGPADLGFAYGENFLDGPGPNVAAATERMIEVCRRHGVACGVGSANPEEVVRWRDRGCTFLTFGPDYALLLRAIAEGLLRIRGSAL